MTNSPTNSVPSTTTRVNYFTGLARRRRKLSLLPANGDGSTLSLDFTTGVLDPRLTFTRASGGTYVGNDGFVYGVDFATSSSLAIGTGSKSVTLTATAGASRRYEIGQTVYIANGANNMSGAVTAYNASTQVLTINATSTSGSGSFTSWIVGNASARFDYDPSTLQPRGLLIEGSANNICEQGQYCWGTGATKIWVRSAGINVNSVNGTGGSNIVARIDGPDGGSLTGTSVVKDASLQFVRFNVDVTVAASTTYTFSTYVRAPSGGNPYMRLAAFNGGTWLATTGGTTASGITITDTANNGSRFNGVPSTAWVRVWVTFTTQAGQTAATIAFYPDTDTTSAATMYVWGAQVELGSGPSSVIPTGASTGSRTLDSCYIAGTNFTSWFRTGAGTVVAQSDNVCNLTSGQNTLCNFSDSTTNNYIRMGDGTGGGPNELLFTGVGGVNQGSADSGFNPALNTAYKTAYAWDTNNFAICANGGAVGTDTTGSLASAGVITSVTIGGDFYQSAGPNSINMKNGHIRSWKYYPTRLTNAQLQALTT